MMGPLSGLQGMQGMQGMQGLQNNLNNNLTGMKYENIKNLDNFMEDGGIQSPKSITQLNDLANNTEDMELKADLQGLIEKNQDFDSDTIFGDSGITPGEVANKFSDVLGNYINNVNGKNKEAEKAVETFVSGGNIDMHSVMIAAEKANLSMQLAVQMKNKIIQAYQEISRIQI